MVEKNLNNKKIKWYHKLILGFIFVLSSPLMVVIFFILLMAIIVLSPIEYVCYKRSAFYRDFKCKYRLFISLESEYTFYNLMKKLSINLKFYYVKSTFLSYIEVDSFYLIFEWFEILEYDEIEDQWMFARTESHELEKLNECLNTKVAENIPLAEKPTKIIVDIELFDKKNYEKAKDDELFFIIENQKDLIKKLVSLQ